MAKIIFTMTNGEKYTLSPGLVKRGKPINNERTAIGVRSTLFTLDRAA